MGPPLSPCQSIEMAARKVFRDAWNYSDIFLTTNNTVILIVANLTKAAESSIFLLATISFFNVIIPNFSKGIRSRVGWCEASLKKES